MAPQKPTCSAYFSTCSSTVTNFVLMNTSTLMNASILKMTEQKHTLFQMVQKWVSISKRGTTKTKLGQTSVSFQVHMLVTHIITWTSKPVHSTLHITCSLTLDMQRRYKTLPFTSRFRTTWEVHEIWKKHTAGNESTEQYRHTYKKIFFCTLLIKEW